MSTSMEGIRAAMGSITSLVGEIADQIRSMEQSARSSDTNSNAVLVKMEELFRLSEILNQTVASFRV